MKKRYWVSATVALIVALDQATKYLADTLIEPAAPVRVLPFFELVNVRNRGAAFGMFNSLGNWFFIPVSLVAVALILYLIVKGREGRLSLTLILSGAVGNLIDRVVLGSVRDFLYFSIGSFHWPAFNVADSALTVGLCLLLLSSFGRGKPHLKESMNSRGP